MNEKADGISRKRQASRCAAISAA